jgi:hypothetical protein
VALRASPRDIHHVRDGTARVRLLLALSIPLGADKGTARSMTRSSSRDGQAGKRGNLAACVAHSKGHTVRIGRTTVRTCESRNWGHVLDRAPAADAP